MGATDLTSRMVELLGRLRREMNGAVADSMRVRGRPYGLNYGVSLPTIRAIARSCPPDHAFSRYLFLQDVRELRLAALTLAEPRQVVPAEFDAWGAGIVNSEVAEEAAFALLSRTECVRELYAAWMAATDPLLRYAALLSAARSRSVPVQEALAPLPALAADFPEDLLLADGVVALLASVGTDRPEGRDAVLRVVGTLPQTAAADHIREQMAWRLDG